VIFYKSLLCTPYSVSGTLIYHQTGVWWFNGRLKGACSSWATALLAILAGTRTGTNAER